MKSIGIICEYNPFHLGHARQYRMIKEQLEEATAIVCVMSGNYVQRGMPAMWDKTTRAAAALACGADLVVELPITGVLQSAEGFASTGVEILNKLGCVDYISFGAECGSAEALMSFAQNMDSPAFADKLRHGLDQGLSYAAARQQALEDRENLLHSPNNILGLEYCRAILKTGSRLQPLVIPRNGDYHAVTADTQEPSATFVRSLFPHGNWQQFVPSEAVSVFTKSSHYDLSWGERAVLARLRSLSDDEWAQCAHGSEGLWSKAMRAARSEATLEDILTALKSKRYPRTRLQRLLLCAYLGISDAQLKQPVPYVRVLGATPKGRELLRKAKQADLIPLVNPGEMPSSLSYYRLECRASDLYTLFCHPDQVPICCSEQNRRILLP